MTESLYDNIQVIAAEKVPPCPDCGSLNVVIYTKNPDGIDRAWCTKCNEVWATFWPKGKEDER